MVGRPHVVVMGCSDVTISKAQFSKVLEGEASGGAGSAIPQFVTLCLRLGI